MPYYAVSLFLEESAYRGALSSLPSASYVLTRVVEAESYLEALALACPGEDCRRIEINVVFGEPLTKGGAA